MSRAILAEAGRTLVLVIVFSKLKVRGRVRLGVLVVVFYFSSWEVAISFVVSLGCGRECLSGRDVYAPGVGSTDDSWISRGFVMAGPTLVVLLGPASSARRIGDRRRTR